MEFYCDILRWLWEDVRQKYPDKWHTNKWVLHYDNVSAHTALAVEQFLASKNMVVVPYPPVFTRLDPV